MALINGDILSIIIAAAIAGIGSGLGVTFGQALYKAFFEDMINKFLDKKHREEAMKNLKDRIKTVDVTPKIESNSVVDNMLGKKL